MYRSHPRATSGFRLDDASWSTTHPTQYAQRTRALPTPRCADCPDRLGALDTTQSIRRYCLSAMGRIQLCSNQGPVPQRETSVRWLRSGYDALWQALNTHPGDSYQVSFLPRRQLGRSPGRPQYRHVCLCRRLLPNGTENLPEPSSLALFGTGVLGGGRHDPPAS